MGIGLSEIINVAVFAFFRASLTNSQALLEGIPGALVTCVILAAHEAGHIYAAKEVGAKLGFPYFVPKLKPPKCSITFPLQLTLERLTLLYML